MFTLQQRREQAQRILAANLPFLDSRKGKVKGGCHSRFVNDTAFRKPNADERFCAPMPKEEEYLKECKTHSRYFNILPVFTEMCRNPVLSREQERHLFMKMNYLKFKANQLRASINPLNPSMPRLQQFVDTLKVMKQTRDLILLANMRLAFHLVKNKLRNECDPFEDFEEKMSDACECLGRAADGFRTQLGNRFSTYATWCIMRNQYRLTAEKAQEKIACFPMSFEGDSHFIPDFPDDPDANTEVVKRRFALITCEDEAHVENKELVTKLLGILNKREAKILYERIGKGFMLHEIAEKEGVTKERIRQIAKNSLARLKEYAKDCWPQFCSSF